MLSDYLRRYEIMSIVTALLMIVVGVLQIVMPVKMIDLVFIIFAAGLGIKGIIDVFAFIFMDNSARRYSNGLLDGFLCIIGGVLLYLNMDFFKTFLPLIIGVFVIFEAIMKMQVSFLFLTALSSSGWILVFLSSILEIVLGFLLLVYPANALVSITIASGIILIVSAILEIIETIVMTKKIRYYSIY